MWHRAICMGHPMRLEVTRVGLLVYLANHYATRDTPPSQICRGIWQNDEVRDHFDKVCVEFLDDYRANLEEALREQVFNVS